MSFALPPTVNGDSRRRGGTPSRRRDHEYQNEPTTTTTAKAQQQPPQPLGQQQQMPVEFEIALRLRPLGKKERDDHIVLEVVPPDCSNNTYEPESSSSTQQQQLLATSVALHPLPRPDLTPSSALILQTLSPETIQTCHDVEFRFDYVFDAQASQDAHVYPTLGRPMAHSVMEPILNMHLNIMNNMNTPSEQQQSTASLKKTTHLVIAMGGQGSGKTYTCWGGGGQIPKRKTGMDGLVPRMVDSLFGQFLRISSQQQQQQQKMHTHQQRNNGKARQPPSCTFAVNLSILQVNQSKNPKHASSSDAGCKVYDLFQPVIVGNPIITSAMTLSPKVKSLVASTFERSRSSPSSSHPTTNAGSSSSNNLDATVQVHQDPVTHEFHVLNGQVRTCKSAERARDALQEAFQNSRKRTSSKRHQSHVLIQIQPVLLDNHNKTVVCEGGSIVVLDMAGNDDQVGSFSTNNKTRLRAGSKRNKDSLPNRNDAHSAVLHCLRSIQFNEQVRRAAGGTSSPISNNNNDDTSMSDLSCPSQHAHEKAGLLNRRASFKQVPYRQHVLTMLLQPCFSQSRTDQTQVSILLAASPGHRDYREKKAIMTEIESFWTPKALPAKQVMTGCLATTASKSKTQQPNLPTKPSPSRSKKQPRPMRGDPHHSASDADDEFESGTTGSKSSSMTSADRPPKHDSVFKKGGAAHHHQHQTTTLATTNTSSLPVKLPLSSRKKASRSNNRPLLYPSSDADDEFDSSTTTELQSWSTNSSNNARPSKNGIFKTKCQQALGPGGGGVEHTLSMAYSDSSMEDDYYTLPPPIAPPPSFGRSNSCPPQRVMSPDASAPPEEHVVVVNKPLTMLPAKPLRVDSSSNSNTGASRGGGFQVPFLSDFPGVSLPFGRTFAEYTSTTTSSSGGVDLPPTSNPVQQQQHANRTASLPTASGSSHHHSHGIESPEVANVKPTIGAADNSNSSMNAMNISSGVQFTDENGSSSSLSATTFNAMKNINKLVHASKKKCERVLEKMATPTCTKDQDNEPSHANSINYGNHDNETSALKQRVKDLEVQNANLLGENESLRQENERLRASSTLSFSPNSLENRGFREQSNNTTKIVLPRNHGQPSPEKQRHHSTLLDQESLSSPSDHRLHGNSPDRLIAYSPGEPLVASPGHGRRSPHKDNRFLPLSPGKPTSSSESQTLLKENAISPYSPVNQPVGGPLALMPGQSLSGSQDQRSLKQSDRSHVLSAGKPQYRSDKEDEYERKFQSSSFLQSPSSPLSCSRAYPSDDENITPPPRRAGISIPMPGEANYVVREDKLRHHSAPTSPMGFGRRDDDCVTAPASNHWQREGRMGAAASYTSSTTNDNSNKDSTTLGSFPSNYKSTLYRWQA